MIILEFSISNREYQYVGSEVSKMEEVGAEFIVPRISIMPPYTGGPIVENTSILVASEELGPILEYVVVKCVGRGGGGIVTHIIPS